MRIINLLGGLKFYYLLTLKTFETLFSILSLSLVYPLTLYIQNKTEFLKNISSFFHLKENHNISFWIIFFLICYWVLRFLFGIYFINISSKYIIQLRFYWLESLLNYYTSINNYNNTRGNKGKIISDWYADTNNSSKFIEGLISIYAIFIYVITFLIYVFLFEPDLLLGVVLSIITYLTFWFLKSRKNLINKSNDKLRQQQNVLEEIDKILQSRRDIVIFKIFDLAFVKLKNAISVFSDTLIENKIKANKTNLNSELFVVAIVILSFFFLTNNDFELTEENISKSILLIALGTRTINLTNQVLNKLIKVSLEFNSFKNLINKLFNSNKLLLANKKPSKIDSIRLENIIYSIDDKVLFKIEKLNLKKGNHYYITGPSGSGKSTFLDLIVGIIPIQKGSIYFTCEDNKYQPNINYFSYVSQNIFIYGNNIQEMICGIKKVDLSKLNKIKEICFIDHFTNKKSTKNLSGGEKARIGIARALYYDRPVIILDESLAFVESEVEKSIVTKIKQNFPDKILLQVIHERKSEFEIDGKIVFNKDKTVSLESV